MTPQERQMIESLFQRLTQGAPQAGPRDPEAEALISQRVQGLPGAAYYLAQLALVQERALQEAEARLAALGQGGGQGSFLPPVAGGPAYQRGAPPAYGAQQPGGGGAGSFLAGAGKIALGVGGGILLADAAMGLGQGLFGGGFGPFGGGFGDNDGEYEAQQDDGGFGDSGDAGDLGGDDSGGGDW